MLATAEWILVGVLIGLPIGFIISSVLSSRKLEDLDTEVQDFCVLHETIRFICLIYNYIR